MDLTIYIQLIFLCFINVFFTLAGTVLNTLVIVSLWKTSQLRKKLCYFMIMLLSCFDLLAVITVHPVLVVYVVVWLTEDYELLTKMRNCLHFIDVTVFFSLLALLVMSTERYLGAYYPHFHRISVTRRGLVMLHATMCSLPFLMKCIFFFFALMNYYSLASMTFAAATIIPLIFINIKLYKITKKIRRNNATSPELKPIAKLKSISTCFLAVACLVFLSIPWCTFGVLNFVAKPTATSGRLSFCWGVTFVTLNSSFNCVIFFWKNKVLRAEGMKLSKTLEGRIFSSPD